MGKGPERFWFSRRCQRCKAWREETMEPFEGAGGDLGALWNAR